MICIIHFDVPDYYSAPVISKTIKAYSYTAVAYNIDMRVIDTHGKLFALQLEETYDLYRSLKDAMHDVNKFILLETKHFAESIGAKATRYKRAKKNTVYVIGPDYGLVEMDGIGDKLESIAFLNNSETPLWSFVAFGILAHDSRV